MLGLIPVGGSGFRLGLPFSKEMLPQKNFDYYNPIINHLVQKMELAGASSIFFIHGKEIKKDIAQYFSSEKYIHLTQEKLGFARVLKTFGDYFSKCPMSPTVDILFGLPDAYFDGNPFLTLTRHIGTACALFKTNDTTKVDRLNNQNNFDIKATKTKTNKQWFWGAFKFSYGKMMEWMKNVDFDKTTEIGDILNKERDKKLCYFHQYLDLGTWDNLNLYWSEEINKENYEIERKYDASKISFANFSSFVSKIGAHKILDISSFDYYFNPLSNNGIQFVRFRDSGKIEGGKSDITIKNTGASSLNRLELSILLAPKNKKETILDFLQLLGLKFAFEVHKRCLIYFFKNYTIVLYEMTVCGKKIKFLEIELNKKKLKTISSLERKLQKLDGFDSAKIIKESKYEIIKKIKNDRLC